MNNTAIAVAWTGASGIQYGIRLLEELLKTDRQIYLLYSQAAQIVAQMETDLVLPSRASEAQAMLCERYGVTDKRLQVFGRQQWTAPPASGSNPPEAMVICPCTSGTLATVANGVCDDLIDRSADVMLKEQRKLILVVRETPHSTIQLENMLRLAQAGATIMPANPGFYFNPQSVEEIIDFMVARILDHLGIEHALSRRWGDDSAKVVT
ncbi:MAG: flavin prenyltransferase UbiX [Sedimenticolaceae bacterium]|nr:flavin prenyltransferase UbiX [Sedimenticolaceae bacterium]